MCNYFIGIIHSRKRKNILTLLASKVLSLVNRSTAMLKLSFSTLLLLTVVDIAVFSQTSYKIDFNIKGWSDSTVYLGYYVQENTYIKDTARVDKNGGFTFDGTQALPQGIYFLVLNKSSTFQFVVGPAQHFSLQTSADDYIKHMEVKGDDDNRLFFENMVFTSQRYKEVEPHTIILKDSTATDEERRKARDGYDAVQRRVMDYQDHIIEKYPTTVTARLLKMSRPIDVPEAPKKADGSIDEHFQYRYYRAHYFDNYDLGDPLTLRQPKVVYWDKVRDYLDRLFIQQADTLTNSIDELIALAARSKDTYRFLVWKLIVHYQSSNIMGLDEVYVNLVDKYIATGEMDYWLDKKTVKNLIDDVDKVRRAMIGRTAPNMVMQNEDFQRRALYDLKTKYTIVYFFKPTCGHCREETPKLVKFYNENKKRLDLEVFAVSTDTTMSELRSFIKEMKSEWITVSGPRSYLDKHFSTSYYAERTPTIYILDERKKIIARRLDVDQIDDFLMNYEKVRTHQLVAGSR